MSNCIAYFNLAFKIPVNKNCHTYILSEYMIKKITGNLAICSLKEKLIFVIERSEHRKRSSYVHSYVYYYYSIPLFLNYSADDHETQHTERYLSWPGCLQT